MMPRLGMHGSKECLMLQDQVGLLEKPESQSSTWSRPLHDQIDSNAQLLVCSHFKLLEKLQV
jgi:hypothetical protein